RWQPEDLSDGLRIAGDEIVAPNPPGAASLQLLTPKAHYFLNSTFANMPRQRKNQGAPLLDMHPDDAGERGLADGQPVAITCDGAEIKAVLRLTDSILSGVVVLEGKWWDQPEETAAVSNLLSKSAWSRAGQPAYNDIFVQVKPSVR
ncbi:MAG: hypothetical protein IH973_13795, partial [Myxococcales bacterium]|nr:hypothetical protein [Myxococcales bacterium]